MKKLREKVCERTLTFTPVKTSGKLSTLFRFIQLKIDENYFHCIQPD